MTYFSDREGVEVPRNVTEISPTVWDGITDLMQERMDNVSFGQRFSSGCGDNPDICAGVDRFRFNAAIQAGVPDISELVPLGGGWRIIQIETPPLVVAMDIIEFCWKSISKAKQGDFHRYYGHYHYGDFDKDAGQSEFRDAVNLIFHRNGLAFTLTEQGRIERTMPVEIGNTLHNAVFQTKDPILNELLETARQKFISPDEKERREALEKLWDAWERIKTIDNPDKKAGATEMLDRAAGSSSPKFRALLEAEAKALTDAGNAFQIRHSETEQETLASVEHVDYLFYRMFAMLKLVPHTMNS